MDSQNPQIIGQIIKNQPMSQLYNKSVIEFEEELIEFMKTLSNDRVKEQLLKLGTEHEFVSRFVITYTYRDYWWPIALVQSQLGYNYKDQSDAFKNFIKIVDDPTLFYKQCNKHLGVIHSEDVTTCRGCLKRYLIHNDAFEMLDMHKNPAAKKWYNCLRNVLQAFIEHQSGVRNETYKQRLEEQAKELEFQKKQNEIFKQENIFFQQFQEEIQNIEEENIYDLDRLQKFEPMLDKYTKQLPEEQNEIVRDYIQKKTAILMGKIKVIQSNSKRYGIRGKVYKQCINVKKIKEELYKVLDNMKENPMYESYKTWIQLGIQQLEILKHLLFYIGKHNQLGDERSRQHYEVIWKKCEELTNLLKGSEEKKYAKFALLQLIICDIFPLAIINQIPNFKQIIIHEQVIVDKIKSETMLEYYEKFNINQQQPMFNSQNQYTLDDLKQQYVRALDEYKTTEDKILKMEAQNNWLVLYDSDQLKRKLKDDEQRIYIKYTENIKSKNKLERVIREYQAECISKGIVEISELDMKKIQEKIIMKLPDDQSSQYSESNIQIDMLNIKAFIEQIKRFKLNNIGTIVNEKCRNNNSYRPQLFSNIEDVIKKFKDDKPILQLVHTEWIKDMQEFNPNFEQFLKIGMSLCETCNQCFNENNFKRHQQQKVQNGKIIEVVQNTFLNTIMKRLLLINYSLDDGNADNVIKQICEHKCSISVLQSMFKMFVSQTPFYQSDLVDQLDMLLTFETGIQSHLISNNEKDIEQFQKEHQYLIDLFDINGTDAVKQFVKIHNLTQPSKSDLFHNKHFLNNNINSLNCIEDIKLTNKYLKNLISYKRICELCYSKKSQQHQCQIGQRPEDIPLEQTCKDCLKLFRDNVHNCQFTPEVIQILQTKDEYLPSYITTMECVDQYYKLSTIDKMQLLVYINDQAAPKVIIEQYERQQNVIVSDIVQEIINKLKCNKQCGLKKHNSIQEYADCKGPKCLICSLFHQEQVDPICQDLQTRKEQINEDFENLIKQVIEKYKLQETIYTQIINLSEITTRDKSFFTENIEFKSSQITQIKNILCNGYRQLLHINKQYRDEVTSHLKDYKFINILGDGNCLYRSMEFIITNKEVEESYEVQRQNDQYLEFKNIIMSLIDDHLSYLNNQLQTTSEQDRQQIVDQITIFTDYEDCKSKNKFGDLKFIDFMNLYLEQQNKNILLHCSLQIRFTNNEFVTNFRKSQTQESLPKYFIYYNQMGERQGHFEVIMLEQSQKQKKGVSIQEPIKEEQPSFTQDQSVNKSQRDKSLEPIRAKATDEKLKSKYYSKITENQKSKKCCAKGCGRMIPINNLVSHAQTHEQ